MKLKKFFSSKAGKSAVLVLAVLVIGLAVYLNYRWFYDPINSLGYGENNMEDSYSDSTQTGANTENGENDYTVYEVDLSKLEKRDEGALSLLEYLASLEGSTLYYNVQWGGGYGAYITSIGSLNPDPTCQYISLYTTEEADFAVPTEWSPTVATATYGEITLTYAGVGLSSMHINDGTVILFRLEGF